MLSNLPTIAYHSSWSFISCSHRHAVVIHICGTQHALLFKCVDNVFCSYAASLLLSPSPLSGTLAFLMLHVCIAG